jgi:fructose-specific phosphotransferase system IIA component
VKLSDLIKRELVCLDIESTEKTGSIAEMAESLVRENIIRDEGVFLREVLGREKMGSSGIGEGVAIPHARTGMVEEIIIAFGRSRRGINFESLDRKPVYLLFLIASPTNDNELYLQTLSCLSRFLREREHRESLLQAKTVDEVFFALNSFEKRLLSPSNLF